MKNVTHLSQAQLLTTIRTFAAEKGDSMSSRLLLKAIGFVIDIHQDEKDCSVYIDHVLRVVCTLISVFGITDPFIITAALLRHSVERHSKTLSKRLHSALRISNNDHHNAVALIQQEFGRIVGSFVKTVTNHDVTKIEHLSHLLMTTTVPSILLLADFYEQVVDETVRKDSEMFKLFIEYTPIFTMGFMSKETIGKIVNDLEIAQFSQSKQLIA